MMKYYFLFLVFLFFSGTSCSNNGEIKNKKTATEVVAKFKKFKASGNEPGWSLDIINSDESLHYQLVLDYGEVQFSGEAVSVENEQNEISQFILYQKSDGIFIHLEDVECSDMAGFPHDLDIKFQYKNYQYIGCGDFDKIQLKESEAHLIQKLDHYICFNNDEKISPRIWIGFNVKDYALQVKYEGQHEAMDLQFVKEEYIEGGAHPTLIKYYNEIVNGQINGSYKITHSGIWDYVLYERKRDGKAFNFTIDQNANPYGKMPCF